MSFNLLTTLGLRQHHRLLDIGCGSLRIGRLLIPYLNTGHYTGIEPNSWLVEERIHKETGADQIRIKKTAVIYSDQPEAVEQTPAFDFALAQSIFSHCGLDLIHRWLNAAARCLRPSGALVATAIVSDEDFVGRGWIYPACVAYTWSTLCGAAEQAGLRLAKLHWTHPRQSWLLFAMQDFDLDWIQRRGLSWNAMMEERYPGPTPPVAGG